MKKTLRIFISSPSDVQQERIAAKKVIAELNKTFSKQIVLEPLLWEDMPLLASSSFQEGIDKIINQYSIDVAVFILWSRLGSTLGKSYTKPDGTPYRSGTEYEFDMMMESFRKNGNPKIMVYIKDTPIRDRLIYAKEIDLEDAVKQHSAVKNFIKERFHDASNGSTYAYTSFGENVSFESRLKTHLSNIILDVIGSHDNIVEWHENPYVGLNSYEREQSPIFFGREKNLNKIIPNVLGNLDNNVIPSLILLGESGSGKSSFIKAGILPMLESLDGKYKFVMEKTSPSLLGENIYHAFSQLFLSYYPDIKDNPVYDEIINEIPENYNFSHLRYALEKSDVERYPIFFIDQFEELFSDARISQENKLLFLRFLRGLIETQKMFVIISMRNDFYSYFATYAEFGRIKQISSMTYDMCAMGGAELESVICEPARMAGLEWELNKDGISLDKEIINEATQIKDLPLIEFALSELYKHKTDKGVLTFDAYEKIGGIEGAFTNYVNCIYNSFSSVEKDVFQELLGRVITISSADGNTFVRKVALMSECSISEIHASVIKKAVDAHIFKSDKNVQGFATLTIVHEMLITSWDVILKWIDQEKKFITDNDYYEQSAQHWVEADKPNSLLLTDEESLLKAEYFYYWWKKLASPNTIDYLNKSFRYHSIFGATKWGLYLLVFLALISFTISSDTYVEGYIMRKVISIISTAILAVPLFLNFIIYLRKKTYFLIAEKVKNIWICFTVLWLIIEGVNIYVNPLDYLNFVAYGLDIVVFFLFVTATINACYKHRLRRRWKNKVFKVPFAIKYLNRKKYKIVSTIISAFSVAIFIFSIILTFEFSSEYSKLGTAETEVDNLNYIVERINNEIGINTAYFYTLNENRAAYLKEMYPDSVDVTSQPNNRKYELARTFYYRSMPDSVITLLSGDKNPEHQTLLSYAYLQKGDFKTAANSLPENLDTLLSCLPTYWMSKIAPIDIFALSGDYQSAKHYYESILKIAPDIEEHPLSNRIKAILCLDSNIELTKDYYSKYMEYRISSKMSDEEPVGEPILLSAFIYANRLSYSDAQAILDEHNISLREHLKNNLNVSSNGLDSIGVNLAILNAEKQEWPSWLNGSWVGLEERDDAMRVWTFTINDGALRFEIDNVISEEGEFKVNDHGAWPCRYVDIDGCGAVEALSFNGGHFVMAIMEMKNDTIEAVFVNEETTVNLCLKKLE